MTIAFGGTALEPVAARGNAPETPPGQNPARTAMQERP